MTVTPRSSLIPCPDPDPDRRLSAEPSPAPAAAVRLRITARWTEVDCAGRRHPRYPVVYPPGFFAADQEAALRACPGLRVLTVEGPLDDRDRLYDPAADHAGR